MKILALEFSSAQRSVAVLQGPPSARSAGLNLSEAVETGGPATQAFAMIALALRQANLERQQIEVVAVGLGPGSYTGIRAAIAIAQGWQLTRGVELLGLSSAECLAAQARTEGLQGPVAVAIDAQRGEFYLANYEVGSESWREVRPLRLATLVEVRQTAMAGETVIGPETLTEVPRSCILFPRAAMLARQAWQRTDFVPGERLEPIYLRAAAFVKAPPARHDV